jgi:hypothetical protein
MEESDCNGLAFDCEGRLLMCEHGERRVTRPLAGRRPFWRKKAEAS